MTPLWIPTVFETLWNEPRAMGAVAPRWKEPGSGGRCRVVEGVLHVIGYHSNEVLLRECRISIETLESAWHWFDHYASNNPSIKYFQDIN